MSSIICSWYLDEAWGAHGVYLPFRDRARWCFWWGLHLAWWFSDLHVQVGFLVSNRRGVFQNWLLISVCKKRPLLCGPTADPRGVSNTVDAWNADSCFLHCGQVRRGLCGTISPNFVRLFTVWLDLTCTNEIKISSKYLLVESDCIIIHYCWFSWPAWPLGFVWE